jgi:hypothetical protein
MIQSIKNLLDRVWIYKTIKESLWLDLKYSYLYLIDCYNYRVIKLGIGEQK